MEDKNLILLFWDGLAVKGMFKSISRVRVQPTSLGKACHTWFRCSSIICLFRMFCGLVYESVIYPLHTKDSGCEFWCHQEKKEKKRKKHVGFWEYELKSGQLAELISVYIN